MVFIAINLVMKEKIGEKILKHYVRILFSNPPRIKDEKVPERNKDTIDFPEGALAYVFYDRNEVIAEDGELLIGEKKNISEAESLGTEEEVWEEILDVALKLREKEWWRLLDYD